MNAKFNYIVILKRSNERYVDRISFLLSVLAVLAFVEVQVKTGTINYFFSIAALLVLAGIIMNQIAAWKGRQVRYKNWLLVAGIFWIGMPIYAWIAILYFLLAFLEYQAKYPLEIGFKNDLVLINTLFKRKFAWTEFNNVILKDGLLTLDFKNNKLFQKEVLDDDEPDADEDEFNEYCRERLSLAGEQRMTVNK